LNVSIAGDAAAGKAKAATCNACHGANGISIAPNYPNLAGQKEAYLVKQMKAFKDGTRKDPTMNAMAAPLSDADMANLAAHYAGLK
jgi:cytochrome c553